MGKSHVLWKMEAEAEKSDRLIVYRDLEGIRTPVEFAGSVLKDVEVFLSPKEKVATRARKLIDALGGTEIGGLIRLPDGERQHWKTVLVGTLDDLAEHEERPIVFFWDELPLMLYNIRERSGEEVAMEVIDVLRQVRQSHRAVRMVYTGSIGLHNVLTSLKEAGHANAAVNDMRVIEVPPLDPPDAADLTQQLFEGEHLNAAPEAADALAEAVDYIAFYIHHVVDELKLRGSTVDLETIRETVLGCLTSPQDEWHMAHYRERLDTYYGTDRRDLSLAILDAIAHDGPLAFDDLVNRLRSLEAGSDSDDEHVRSMLTLLQRDHYLSLDDERYAFRFPLIRRWWALHRG